MNYLIDHDLLVAKGKSLVTTIDSHTEGEITRLIVAGLDDPPGDNMREKLKSFRARYDHVRCLLTKEPRGRGILAAAVTTNTTPGAAFGLIYMDARRYPHLCGHATIGAVVTLARTGFLQLTEGENTIQVDTPSGVMEAQANVHGGDLKSVAIHMVPSFVMKTGQWINVDGFGKITVDLVCTGGTFAMVDAKTIGIAPVIENKEVLVDLGMKIIDAANNQLEIKHPIRPDVNTVDVTEFYDSEVKDGRAQGKGIVVYGESHMDRSPCGTGTAAKLALLHHYKKISMHQTYTNSSPIGTTFKAALVKKTKIGPEDAFVARIEGNAWITGIHQYSLDKTDPFQDGFLV